ncbi:hypothetical protein MMC30_007966 [Trapelia coarctata]|nr:hypothetical protein [Trapelia coarctata]
MASILVPTFHIAQAVVSAYGFYTSYVSITNLQKHEEKSEKAAQWSNTAAHQLHKTRTTQATGAGAILASLVASLVLFICPSLPIAAVAAVNFGIAGIVLAARIHIGNFWKGKARVPFVGGYNEGMKRTEELFRLLGLLAISWAITGVSDFLFVSLV